MSSLCKIGNYFFCDKYYKTNVETTSYTKYFQDGSYGNISYILFITTDLSGAVPTPHLWGQAALDRMKNVTKDFEKLKLKSQIISSQRMYMDNLVTNKFITYDAYERDIAILNVFFETPTVLEYTTEHSKTWFDFISAVGGNGGLFIGFSIVTVLEIVWLLFEALLLYIKE